MCLWDLCRFSQCCSLNPLPAPPHPACLYPSKLGFGGAVSSLFILPRQPRGSISREKLVGHSPDLGSGLSPRPLSQFLFACVEKRWWLVEQMRSQLYFRETEFNLNQIWRAGTEKHPVCDLSPGGWFSQPWSLRNCKGRDHHPPGSYLSS